MKNFGTFFTFTDGRIEVGNIVNDGDFSFRVVPESKEISLVLQTRKTTHTLSLEPACRLHGKTFYKLPPEHDVAKQA